MKGHTIRGRLLASSTICGIAMLAAASPALAQQATPPPPPETEVGEVVVTGTRIANPNQTSVSPVQVVTDQEFRLAGKTDVVDLMNNLPQNVQNGQTDFSSVSNPLFGPGGVSTANLRGLGPQRTLVLVDGRRLGIGDANSGNPNPAPDLNQIPSALIDRVEVLTGGASSTYGSDAVAGVINFIMKRNFSGFRVEGQYGVAWHEQGNDLAQRLLSDAGFAKPKDTVWDGRTKDLTFVFGLNGEDGRGNITAFVTYHDQEPITQGARDFSACKINVGPPEGPSTPVCSGSPNSNLFIDLVTGNEFTVVGRQFLPYPQANSVPPALFNSNPLQYLQHQDTRYTAGYFARYELNEHVELYSDFSFMHDRSRTEIAPSGQFLGGGAGPSGGDLINCDNPLLSAQQAAAICTPAQIAAGENVEILIGRRAIEGGGRQSNYEHENYRVVFGVRGTLPEFEAFKYDVYGQYYYTSLFQENKNYLSLARLARALQVVNVGGVPTCRSVVNRSDAACLPYNIFSDGGVTQATLAYLNSTGTQKGTISQRTFAANLTGDLGQYGVKSPWAETGIGVALGVETRHEHYEFAPDAASLSGDLSGFGGASTAIDANLGVTEVYVEARLPLLENLSWADELSFEAGYRYSDYTTGVNASTYKFGVEWAPVEDIRFRASYQRAIRAPNIVELFNPQAVTNTSQVASDPCSGTAATPAAATLEQCVRTGVTPAQYGDGGATNRIIQCPAGQCAVLNGGNPELDPETADTYAVGFTVRPRWVSGFTGSLDYWRIKVRDVIGTVPLDFTLDQCLATGNPLFCSGVVRTPSGNLFGTTVVGGGYIRGTASNVASVETSGVDVQAAYNLPLERFGRPEWGGLAFTFSGSYLIESKNEPTPGAHIYDCAGLFGATCQSVNPHWRHTLRASWNSPWNATFSAQWRYIGAADLETNTDDATLSNGVQDTFDAKLKAVNYLDLSASWKVREWFTLRGGINNVFDKDPQIISSLIAQTGSPNAYPTYDLLGRQVFIAFTADF